MKSLRLISVVALLAIVASGLAKPEWKKTTVKYEGETYIVKTSELSNTITNKKYVMPKGTEAVLIPVRSYDDQERLNDIAAKIKNIMYSVFPEELWPALRKGHFAQASFFDVKTSDYIGGYFYFSYRIKDLITVEKIYEIEQKLAKAGLNAGKQEFTKPNKKYFEL